MKANMIQLGLNQPLEVPARVAAVGNWSDPHTYVIMWQYLETPHVEIVTCTFDGDTVSLALGSSLIAPDDPRFDLLEKQFIGTLE